MTATLGDVPVSSGAAELLPLLDEVRPDTIVTFGPDGMTGHEDHRAISAWVTEAWRRSGCRGDLWYATLTPEFHADWGHLNDEVGLWFEGSTPPVTARADLAAEVRLSGWQLSRKQRALRAHASQTRPLEDLVGSERYRAWWATESFVAAERHPSVATGARRTARAEAADAAEREPWLWPSEPPTTATPPRPTWLSPRLPVVKP